MMWLILGGNGQLGKSFGQVLTSEGIPHRLLGQAEADITNPHSLEKTLQETNASHIVNCAAWTAVDDAEEHEQEAHRINCEGARNVASIAREHGSTLVHISTDYVFSGTGTEPYVEDQLGQPVSAYGRSKYCGELAIREEYPSDSYIVRTAWLYSEFGHNFVKTMIKKALQAAPVRVVSDQCGQPTLASDLAAHIVDLVTHNAQKGVYHGTNSGEATWFELAQSIYQLVGRDISLVSPVDTSEYPTKAERPKYSVLSHGNTIDNGFKEMRNWKSALTAAIPSIAEKTQL